MVKMVEMSSEEMVKFSNKHKNKIGVRSERLLVTSIIGKDFKNHVFVNAVCDCGNSIIVNFNDIKSGHSKSCGCLRKEVARNQRFDDLTGKTFSWLFVEGVDKNDNKRTKYNCLCVCGNRKTVFGSSLVRGLTKSCGCYSKISRHKRMIDLTGSKFYYLTVIGVHDKNESDKIYWDCICDCGRSCIVSGGNLKSGATKSCGCLKSLPEREIMDYLDRHNIIYQREKKFSDCKYIKELPFDFYIPGYGIIEYDGEFHYKQFEKLGNDLGLQQKRDKIKTDYCKNKNIRLLRIPYWEKDNIESILSEWLNIDCVEEANSSNADLSA